MKKIVITGGSNGIGMECVKKFSSNDYLVFILDIIEPHYELNDNIQYYKCDVGDYSKTLECAHKICEEYGPIDAIINCAGIQIIAPFSEYNYYEWMKIIQTNYFGTCNVIHSFINYLAEYSTILNISSVHANKPRKNKYAYDASKSAIEQLTKELALEFADKRITINALAFGAVNTNMNKDMTKDDFEIAKSKVPLKKIFEPYEMADFAYTIVNSFSKYTTGSIFTIDGGRSLT